MPCWDIASIYAPKSTNVRINDLHNSLKGSAVESSRRCVLRVARDGCNPCSAGRADRFQVWQDPRLFLSSAPHHEIPLVSTNYRVLHLNCIFFFSGSRAFSHPSSEPPCRENLLPRLAPFTYVNTVSFSPFTCSSTWLWRCFVCPLNDLHSPSNYSGLAVALGQAHHLDRPVYNPATAATRPHEPSTSSSPPLRIKTV